MRRRLLITIFAITLLLSIVGTSVFVYMPVNVSIQGTTIPISLQPGENAGGTDLGGYTIGVSIGDQHMSASITVHPTYEYTYYVNILYVNNTDSAVHFVAFKVTQAISDFTQAKMIVDNGTETFNIDLSSTGTSQWIGVSKSYNITISLFFQYDETNVNPPSGSISLELIYSPGAKSSSSAPPAHP